MEIIVKTHTKLYSEDGLENFLAIPPYATDGLKRAQKQLEGREYPRKEVADILHAYNRTIGNDACALENVERLKEQGSVCVVTGQQLGFMGGPAYTVLKAISCLLLAREAGAVPIFWFATEDHDVSEIDHTYLVNALGNLEKFHLSLPKDGRFVEDLGITSHHLEQIAAFLKKVDFSFEVEGHSYTEVMVRLFVKLFAGTGLVFLEPRLLRSLAVPFFKREIVESAAIADVLKQTTQRFEAAGGKPILEVGKGTNLFLKEGGGIRRKINREQEGYPHSEDELLALLACEPERFSSNAAARPVLQSFILPTLAYVAGPSEIAYHHQLLDYYRFHDVPMPWIVPRISATLITPYAKSLLEKCHLNPWDDIPEHWEQLLPSIAEKVTGMEEEWNRVAIQHLGDDLSQDVIQQQVHQAAQRMEKKIYKQRLHQDKIPYYALHFLRNYLHPHGQPQERFLNWWGFCQSDENLVQAFLEHVDWQTKGHVYCYV